MTSYRLVRNDCIAYGFKTVINTHVQCCKNYKTNSDSHPHLYRHKTTIWGDDHRIKYDRMENYGAYIGFISK